MWLVDIDYLECCKHSWALTGNTEEAVKPETWELWEDFVGVFFPTMSRWKQSNIKAKTVTWIKRFNHEKLVLYGATRGQKIWSFSKPVPVSVVWCVCDQHLWSSSSSAGSKSKVLAPQWDIMAKRLSEAGRPSVSLQDEVHELDWTLCGNDLYYKPWWGETHWRWALSVWINQTLLETL